MSNLLAFEFWFCIVHPIEPFGFKSVPKVSEEVNFAQHLSLNSDTFKLNHLLAA